MFCPVLLNIVAPMEDFLDWAFRGLITLTMMGLGWLLVWQRGVERNITLLKERVDHHSNDIKSINDLPTSSSVNDIKERVARIEASVNSTKISAELKAIHQRIDALAEETHKGLGQQEQINRTLNLIHSTMMKS